MIREDDFEVQFPLELMHKDLDLALLTASEFDQTLHLANLTKDLFGSAAKNGLGRDDFAAIYRDLKD